MPDNFLNFIKLGMGNAKSKRKDRARKGNGSSSFVTDTTDPRVRIDTTKNRDFSLEIQERWREDPELKIMRRTIETNPEIFILNNLMMSVQFFENYDEEIRNIRETLVSSREAELNARLRPHKHTLIPDVLQQHVAQRVDFTYMLPTLPKHTIELLQPIRIYVVFDNIEITEASYASPYWNLNDTITYSMQLKPSSSHKGYVQLQRLDVTPPKKTASADDLRLSPIASVTRDEIYSDGDSAYDGKSSRSGESCLVRRNKKLVGLNDDDSIYEDRRYGSQENVFEVSQTNRIKEENAYSASNDQPFDSRMTLRGGKNVTRKDSEMRRGVGKNGGGQYGRTKQFRSANESPAGSTSSGYRSGNYMDTDSDYGYAHTSYSNTRKTSKSSMADSSTMISCTEIPRQCFKKMEYRADGKIYDTRRERRQKLSIKEQRIMQVHQSRNYDVWYLNSTKFMKYFCHIFTDRLAVPMGFDPDISENTQGSVIYRDKVEALEGTMSTKVETFEIVPCVSSQWPECAQEWFDRSRMSWPHYDIIEKVKDFGCHMIPEGSACDKSTSKYQDLEWQLIFPAAERFLETCLTYPQVRVYLISLMLHKTFMRPVDSIFGLTTSHIKNRLFWLVEEDDRPIRWMENRTGESLMRLLNSLYRSISQDEPNLPDYFVKDKNLFQEKSYLLRTQKQLKRIIENPVMYVFHAMENIRHSRSFFPRLNYAELLRILTINILILVNPHIATSTTKSVNSANEFDRDDDQVGGFWDNVNEKRSDQPKQYPRKRVTNKSLIEPRSAYDQVVEIPIRCANLQPQRLAYLLDFFIKHFIKMAEYCHKYGAMPQKTAYVDQAERLAVLLSEHEAHKDAAKTHLEKLYSIKRRTANTRIQSDPPKTPRRNPDMPAFTSQLKSRYQNPDFQDEILSMSQDDAVTKNSAVESTSSTIYSQETSQRDNRQVTRVVIHKENNEIFENLQLRTSDNLTREDREDTSKKINARVISLGDKLEESHLTETTYI